MNPIDDVNHVPLPQSSLQPSDFLEFLEGMKGLLKELGEEISQSKNLVSTSSFPAVSLAVNHQVKILGDIQKMCLEMESLAQQGKGEKGKGVFQELMKAHALLLRSESSERPENTLKKSSSEAGFLASAGSSEKKAKEILFTLKGESKPQASKPPSNLPAQVKQTTPIQPPTSPSLRALATLVATDTKVLDRTPAADLRQKVKLLEHLIVVVETQENMSKPSQKLVGLVRSLVSSHASFEKLDISPLFKAPVSGRKLESSQVSYEEKTLGTFMPKSFSPSKAPTLLPSPTPFEKLIESTSAPVENPQKTEPQSKTPFLPPTSAPFTSEKKIEKRKSSIKKKLKRFWSREDQEDPEEKNRS